MTFSGPSVAGPGASGDPSTRPPEATDDYVAAIEAAAVADRSSGFRLSVRGRAPAQVLAGLVSGTVPEAPRAVASGWRGRAEGSALLTPKGRMVAELRVLRDGPDPDGGFLFDLPEGAAAAALEHLRKYVPPRLAAVADVSAETRMLAVLGPGGADLLRREIGVPVVPAELPSLAEGDALLLPLEGGGFLTVVRSGEVGVPALDVLGPREVVGGVEERLLAAGARAAGAETWETLRVEAGRPAWGKDMDETTIPVEAGIQGRVVDYRKGCFTGQEVLIRIRDRGHVNRHLRGVRMGEARPAAGAPLFRAGEERPVGNVTSAVRSPRFGETIGLGYVRREVDPPAELRVGAPDGPAVQVHDLDRDWAP